MGTNLAVDRWTGKTYPATKDDRRDRYVSMNKDLSSE